MIITSSQIYKSLKLTLREIATDQLEKNQVFQKYMTVSKMSDAWVDDVEYAGPTVLSVKPEGAPSTMGTIIEGGTKRYTASTLAHKLLVAEESLEDCKYEKVIQSAKRLMKAAYKTQDIDAAKIIILSTTAGNVGGTDSVILGSASHTLPGGGTYSNIAATYQTPSIPALIAARVAVGRYPDPNGLIEGYNIEKIVCPLAQEAAWLTINGTDKVTGSNFNDMNIAKSYGLEVVAVKWLDQASTTQWGLITDCDNGLTWLNRRPIKSRTWVDNDAEAMFYSVSYRAALGWTNSRCWYQGNT